MPAAFCNLSARFIAETLHTTYEIAILQQHEFLCAHIFMRVLVIGGNALAIHSALMVGQLRLGPRLSVARTSGEHLAVASANFSIGLVRPGILTCAVNVAVWSRWKARERSE